MKKVIDNLDSLSGWTGSGGASVHALNALDEYIAGNNDNSIMFNFNGLDSYVEKTYSEDITDYDEITIWAYSNSKGNNNYNKVTDFSYAIDFGNGNIFYLPIYNSFACVSVNIQALTSLDKIKIIAKHSDADTLILSYIVTSKELFPFDILQSLQEQLELEKVRSASLKFASLLSGVGGDSYIEFESPPNFLDRFMAIKIDDGINSEIHHINKKENLNKFSFSGLYDGRLLKNTYTDANVYIYYPVEFGTTQKEIVLPSITIWSFAPERLEIVTDLEKQIKTVQYTGEFEEEQIGVYFRWLILIDCEAKEEWELLGEISNIVRKTISKKIIWINGQKGYIDFAVPAVEIYPTEDFDIVPKIQYAVNLEIQEKIYSPISLPAFTDLNFTANIIDQGVL